MSTIRDNKVDLLSTKNIDMKKRRVVNAGAAQSDNDYVTLADVKKILSELVVPTNQKIEAAVAVNTSFVTTMTVQSTYLSNTVYRNTNAAPIVVMISVHATNNGQRCRIYVGNTGSPSTLIALCNLPTNTGSAVFTFAVLPNQYYKLDASVDTSLDLWVEWS